MKFRMKIDVFIILAIIFTILGVLAITNTGLSEKVASMIFLGAGLFWAFGIAFTWNYYRK